MIKHRIILISTWLILSSTLVVFPGFECKAFMMAQYLGAMPSLLLLDEPINSNIAFFIATLLINGIVVLFFAWFFDKKQVSNKFIILLYLSIFSGCLIFPKLFSFTFETYQRIPSVDAAAHVFNTSKETLYKNYMKSMVIPTYLSGCVLGLYFAVVINTILICLLNLKNRIKTTLTRQMEHTS